MKDALKLFLRIRRGINRPFLTAGATIVFGTVIFAIQSHGKIMSSTSVSLGYVILCVKDVGASLDFYEKAFGLKRRFFNEENGRQYGELETGTACLAFANEAMAKASVGQNLTMPSLDQPPLGVEFALVAEDIDALYAQAVKAGASEVRKPEAKPWGQKVAYVRDKDGHLVELCTPVK